MSETEKFFQCPVCRHATKYIEVGYASFYGMQVQLFSCNTCSTVFRDPQKFGSIRPSHNILSQEEIDALLAATGSAEVAQGANTSLTAEDPLIALGRLAFSDYIDEMMLEMLQQDGGSESYPDFKIDELAKKIKARGEEGKELTDSQTAFLSLYESEHASGVADT